MITPKYYTIVSGVGKSEYEIVAFDKALVDAGIGDYNLVRVSSIMPPSCTFRKEIDLEKGSIVFAAYACKTVRDEEIGSTAVAIAISNCVGENGVIFETSSDHNDAKDIVQEMCKDAMGTRGRKIKEIITSATSIKGCPQKYTCGISAVVMW